MRQSCASRANWNLIFSATCDAGRGGGANSYVGPLYSPNTLRQWVLGRALLLLLLLYCCYWFRVRIRCFVLDRFSCLAFIPA